MADAAVEFLLNNLKDLLLYHFHLIKNAQIQLQILENDLSMFKDFLEDHSTKKRNKSKALKQLMREIRDVVYEAEDIIDDFVTQAAENNNRYYFMRIFRGRSKLLSLGRKIEDIGPKVKQIYDKSRADFATQRIGSISDTGMAHKESKQIIKVPSSREDNVVGFEAEAQTLISYLKEEAEELDVISVIGMPGLGKTTLARKIFKHPDIERVFLMRTWVDVSQEYNKRDMFFAILSDLINQYSVIDGKKDKRKFIFRDALGNFIKIEDDDDAMKLKSKLEPKTDDEIVQIICSVLEKIEFLIVLDDVWSAEAWIDLQDAFPKFHKTGKILITSRNEEVAWRANRNRDPHKLRLLTDEESWQLLQLEVFGKAECPDPDFQVPGKDIVKRCGGMPLAIVVIGGILIKKASTRDIRAMKDAWRKVSESMSTYLSEDTRMENIISLSYNKLPYNLRPCFLYLGMFPEDFEIPVWQLINMWIAEGLIEKKKGISLEETAQDHLKELVNRNLVMIGKVNLDGKMKSCRLHDMLREFCKNEAGSKGENLFQEMTKSGQGAGFEPLITEIQKSRRLCIDSNVLSFISSKPFGPRVRSFLSFSKEAITLPDENISFIPAAFKLLRVLDARPFIFTKFPKGLTKLVHLRYVALSSNFKVLPEAISKLWNLQTLIVYTSCRILEIKADIWKMIQLRHIETNTSTILPKPAAKTKDQCKQLQILGTIAPQSCTEVILNKVSSLRKLGIHGHVGELLDVKGLEKLDNLEKLKIISDFFYILKAGPTPGLPEPNKFPPNLRSLTLLETFLEWRHISTLGMLDTLKVLKLKNNAFNGRRWEVTEGGFIRLEVLHMEHLNLTFWKVPPFGFPSLRSLVLRNCENLAIIPSSLRDTLQQVDLQYVSQTVVYSAWMIEKERKSLAVGFKLRIGGNYKNNDFSQDELLRSL